MGNEGHIFTPPDLDESNDGSGYFPGSAETAWKQKLIEIRHQIQESDIDNSLKKKLLIFIDPYLTSAGMTNITLGQVNEFLVGFDALMLQFKIGYPEAITRDLIYVIKPLIKEELKLQLNKAIEGWQGDHAFEMQHRYDVRQRQETHDFSDRIRRKFSFGKKREEERE